MENNVFAALTFLIAIAVLW